MVTTAPYGTWRSAIAADVVAAADGRSGSVQRHGGATYWVQSLSTEGGRVTVFRAGDGEQPRQLLAGPWNARNRLYEYGATAYTVAADRLVFTSWDDQRVHAVPIGDGVGEPAAITPEPSRPHGLRYGDLRPGFSDGEVWCVRETVVGDRPTDIRRDLVALHVDGREPRVLAASHHFMTAPTPSPDGRHAAWIGWDHPAMPWDSAVLCVAEIAAGGAFGAHRVLAGGPTEAVCQVEWDSPDSLLALTDPTGWWNLHRIPLDGGPARNLAPVDAEIGGPLWKVGARWFAPLGGGRFVVVRGGGLALLDEHDASITDIPVPGRTSWDESLAVEGDRVFGAAGGPAATIATIAVHVGTGTVEPIAPQPDGLPDTAWLPVAQRRVVAGVPVLYYPPTSPDFTGPDDELPPLAVSVHGGPTGANSAVLDLGCAFLTSRGFAVVAPDYGGSTGHGRAWRERLKGQWGVVDIDDCAAVALALAAQGRADRNRLLVRGRSAGGFTTAASMTAAVPEGRSPVYRCGTAMYPVIDLLRFASGETHDFESRYLDGMVGVLPDDTDRYVRRSPSSHADRLSGPILILQGLEDQVCPPAQSERFVAAVQGSGTPHAYVTFAGEQHGFRKAENIAAAAALELAFYGQVLGIDVPDAVALTLRH